MTKKAKTLILIFSFLAFFILAYLVLLNATGYQFDFRSFKWVKTGGILVKANLDGVEVFINDRLRDKTSFFSNTFIEKNIRPGKYNLRIEKDGFLPLSKSIEVKSSEAVLLTHIYLTNAGEIEKFLENSKLEDLKLLPVENKTRSILSPDKKKMAEVGINEITILWLEDDGEPPYFRKDRRELVLRIGEKIDQVFWFKTSWHLIYLTSNGNIHFIEVDPTGGKNDLEI